MRWEHGRKSSNIEDRRGRRPTRGFTGGGIIIVLLALVAMYFGIDPSFILQLGSELESEQTATIDSTPTAEENRLTEFIAVVLADTEDTWNDQFNLMGRSYTEPKLVLFSGAVSSACGFAQAAMGPFYCPADHKVYIDLSFYRDLKDRMHAPGDFAQAYVIAHEVGHHVQTLLGITEKMRMAKRDLSEREYNRLLVRLELQADCLAGVWAHHADRARGVVEPGDIEEALNAASQIGDDRLQQQSRGYVTPNSFTHGTSAQRARWFRQGYVRGEFDGCDTFAARDL